jgi:hypothetical protein
MFFFFFLSRGRRRRNVHLVCRPTQDKPKKKPNQKIIKHAPVQSTAFDNELL